MRFSPDDNTFYTKFRKSFGYGEKGFTLVELLIVVAILGTLVAVAVPNLISFIGTGEQEAKATEFDVVQTAMIAVMDENNIAAVAEQTTAVGTLAGLPIWDGKVVADDKDFDDFIMNTDVAYTYTWDANGLVSQP